MKDRLQILSMLRGLSVVACTCSVFDSWQIQCLTLSIQCLAVCRGPRGCRYVHARNVKDFYDLPTCCPFQCCSSQYSRYLFDSISVERVTLHLYNLSDSLPWHVSNPLIFPTSQRRSVYFWTNLLDGVRWWKVNGGDISNELVLDTMTPAAQLLCSMVETSFYLLYFL